MRKRKKALRRRYGRFVGAGTSWYRYKGLVPVHVSQSAPGLWYARAVAPDGRELVVTGATSEGAQHEIEWQIETRWRGFDRMPQAWGL